ncbi:MAG: hypothetical protein ABFD92_17455 [Planctomycetaceae bacterium]
MNAAAFFEAVRPMFGGSLTQSQVDGMNVIFEAWRKVGDGNIRHLAYILGTAYHESARTMQPVRETLAKTDAKAKEILTKAWKAGKLPWVKSDYWSSGWFGRGFVQLTHKANYVKAGEKLGIDLVSDPSKAMIPEVSALILIRGMQEGWFTGKKLSDAGDFLEARRIVNGTDKAGQIATYANSFLSALEAAEAASPATEAPRHVKGRKARQCPARRRLDRACHHCGW